MSQTKWHRKIEQILNLSADKKIAHDFIDAVMFDEDELPINSRALAIKRILNG